MQKVDIIVGIPTLNEADSIQHTTTTVDRGLLKYSKQFSCLIVNVDNGSSDGTKNVFLKTQTKTDKVSLTTRGEGKGRNILRLLEYALQRQVKYVCMFDADLKTITPDWVQKFLDPMIHEGVEYVVPLYRRNKYEGNTTNHFCHPILAAYLGAPIRQPIAGDFGLSAKLIKYILKQKKSRSAYQYGIDIFLTMHAVGGGFSIKEVVLGEKIHKPSFGKMVPMFEQVASTAFFVLPKYRNLIHVARKGLIIKNSFRPLFLKYVQKPSIRSIQEREQFAIGLLKKYQNNNPLKDFLKNCFKEYSFKRKLSPDTWCQALDKCVQLRLDHGQNERFCNLLAKTLTPLYLLRVLSYFQEIEWKQNSLAERIVADEVNTLSKCALMPIFSASIWANSASGR